MEFAGQPHPGLRVCFVCLLVLPFLRGKSISIMMGPLAPELTASTITLFIWSLNCSLVEYTSRKQAADEVMERIMREKREIYVNNGDSFLGPGDHAFLKRSDADKNIRVLAADHLTQGHACDKTTIEDLICQGWEEIRAYEFRGTTKQWIELVERNPVRRQDIEAMGYEFIESKQWDIAHVQLTRKQRTRAVSLTNTRHPQG